ncbi:helix-turn-helix domain-containing protein [Paraferrimonas sedimenticola]|uniref:Transcriptional regulator n=1 Tax=Paraferrimonas sedimenticola TaxID=375674 RepID=A0AA37RZQ2_9GAMM|nr:helix-turn-helix transcriptional regulator [Paraferrimonas sedimenticola]GLP97627.1 transcriptional regulator [Paraferrimonas sedimenticola]
MNSTLTIAVSFSLSQVIITALVLLKPTPHGTMPRALFGALLLAVSGYLLFPLADDSARIWLGPLQTLVPGLFWLFCASLFDDHFRIKLWHLALIGLTVVLPIAGHLYPAKQDWLALVLFYLAPQLLEFGLIAMALWRVIKHWKIDLMQSRRRLRAWFCGFIGVIIFGLILSRETWLTSDHWLSQGQYLLIGVVLLITNGLLFNLDSGLFGTPASPVANAPSQDTDSLNEPQQESGLTPALMQLLEQEHIYREMGLTIGTLASRLEVPEYRLRQHINQAMGYKNFNDFLNGFRVRDAAEQLRDPNRLKVPVLTIAHDTGFRSLSSFNKAFKSAFELTPTAYRQANIKMQATD